MKIVLRYSTSVEDKVVFIMEEKQIGTYWPPESQGYYEIQKEKKNDG